MIKNGESQYWATQTQGSTCFKSMASRDGGSGRAAVVTGGGR